MSTFCKPGKKRTFPRISSSPIAALPFPAPPAGRPRLRRRGSAAAAQGGPRQPRRWDPHVLLGLGSAAQATYAVSHFLVSEAGERSSAAPMAMAPSVPPPRSDPSPPKRYRAVTGRRQPPASGLGLWLKQPFSRWESSLFSSGKYVLL